MSGWGELVSGGDMMTRPEVAKLFRVTSVTIKRWAASDAVALTEVPCGSAQGRPGYRRAEVQALYDSGFRGFESRSAASRLRRR